MVPSFSAGLVALNPGRQVQLYVPLTLVHMESGPQISAVLTHSSMSADIQQASFTQLHTK